MKRTQRFPPRTYALPCRRAIFGALATLGFLVVGSALPAAASPAGPSAGAPAADAALARGRRLDFDQMWRFVERHYPFFDEKATDWRRVRTIFRPRAAQARSREEFLHVLEGSIWLLMEGEDPIVLSAGDSAYFLPHQMRRYENRGKKAARPRQSEALLGAGVPGDGRAERAEIPPQYRRADMAVWISPA